MYATRWTMTRVLPDPGPARINSGPATVATASRWCGFNPAKNRSARSVVVVVVIAGRQLYTSPCDCSPRQRLPLSPRNCPMDTPSRSEISADSVRTPERRFGNFDPHGKAIPQVFEMGDNQDLLELGFDRLNRFDDPIAAVLILRAEALVDDEGLQSRAGAMRQQP